MNHLLDLCEIELADDGVVFHFKELCECIVTFLRAGRADGRNGVTVDEYKSSRPNMTYCQFIAETAHDIPSKAIRLKTIFFLQGSPFYDLQAAEKRLDALERLFYERAIVYGRVR